MSKLVTIFGGSGFAGRYTVRRLARKGWRVRVAVRRPNEALQLKAYGSVGQIEPVFCNIRDDASVLEAMQGADAVINCVGILVEQGRNKFDALHHQGAARIARIAREQDVARLVHMSSIGADPEAASTYARSKGLGEAEVVKHFANATILRPSVMFGAEDQFFNKFAKMAGLGPVIALVGGATLMQPVYVDDVAQATVNAVSGEPLAGVFELGGPETKSLHALVETMLAVTKRRRLIANLPFWIGSVVATGFDALQVISLGLIANHVLTRDQVKLLRNDNVASNIANGLSDLGVKPTPLESVLPGYLWPYRSAGQFSDIKASAKNLGP